MNLSNHPCFNDNIRHTVGRIHLPVAPRCNIQCRFCNRKFDCVNESRPGVSSGILTPAQALVYLKEAMHRKPNIAVVGIAGPGDPFANPEETMETLESVRRHYPDILLCVASNGLKIEPYIESLTRIRLSHVTITVNAVDPMIGGKIYAYVRDDKRAIQGEEAARTLMERQLGAIEKLKEKGIIVKVNAIVIPGVNDHHIESIARKMGELNVDILNCIPYYPNKGSAFENIPEPPAEMIKSIRGKAGKYIKQMHHCTRCRADAVGLLGDAPDKGLMQLLQSCESASEITPLPNITADKDRPYVAVASREGVLVNQHLGEAFQFLIYGEKDGKISFVEKRLAPGPGSGDERWEKLSKILDDCRVILVSGAGQNPHRILTQKGIHIMEIEGLIEQAVNAIYHNKSLHYMTKRPKTACAGSGVGCM